VGWNFTNTSSRISFIGTKFGFGEEGYRVTLVFPEWKS
jgi:hypothetical protein